MKKKAIIILIIVALAGIGLYFVVGKKSTLQTQAGVGTSVGDIAPAFSYRTLDGTIIDSASLRGKIIIMSSAAQWCSTCQEEAREFVPIYQKYKDKQVVFITIDIDPRDTKESIEQFKKTYGTPWDYADAQGGREIIQKYGMKRFEMTYIIDKSGKITFNGNVLTHPDKLDAEIQKSF